MCNIGERESEMVAFIPERTGLKRFTNMFQRREQFYLHGIAEGHVVIFAMNLALEGIIPVLSLYSSINENFVVILSLACRFALSVSEKVH